MRGIRGGHSKFLPPLGGGGTQVASSLFDEVLCLLTAQEDTWPLCHSPH